MSIVIDGIEYDSKLLGDLRKVLIEFRAMFLNQDDFNLTIPLSHTIIILDYLIEEEKKKENHDE